MTDFWRARPDLLPSLSVVLASGVWGLFWIPMRALRGEGLDGAWAGLSIYLCSAALCLPVVFWRRRHLAGGGTRLLITGLFTGAAFSLYAASLLLTEVVRALLLFYMTPIWSTLLGWLLLGERITVNRILAIVLGFAGLAAILGFEGGFPWPRNLGDWMGLCSGLAWAYGSLRVYSDSRSGVLEQVVAFVAGGLAVSALLALLPLQGLAAPPSAAALQAVAPWLLLMAGVFVLPSMVVVFWGAGRLSPGRLGILFLCEILVGVVSAAALAGEPFGAPEIVGTLLITAAGVVEVARPQARRGPAVGGAEPSPGAASGDEA